MKRKYMGAMNNILKGIKDVELKKTAIAAAMLQIETREKQFAIEAEQISHKPKNDRWKIVVKLHKEAPKNAFIVFSLMLL